MSKFSTINLNQINSEHNRYSNEGASGGGKNVLDNYVKVPRPKPGQSASIVLRLLPPGSNGLLFAHYRYQMVNDRRIVDSAQIDFGGSGRWEGDENAVMNYYKDLYKKADKLRAQGKQNEANQYVSEARQFRVVERYIYNCVVRSAHDENGQIQKNVGPKLLSVGKNVHKMIINAISEQSDEYVGNVVDPEKGYDFMLKVEMRNTDSGTYPNYDRSVFSREPSPLGTASEIDYYFENLHDLSAIHKPTPKDVIEKQLAMYLGIISSTEENSAEDYLKSKYGKEPVSNEGTFSKDESNDNQKSFHSESSELSANTSGSSSSGFDDDDDDLSLDDEEFMKQVEAFRNS